MCVQYDLKRCAVHMPNYIRPFETLAVRGIFSRCLNDSFVRAHHHSHMYVQYHYIPNSESLTYNATARHSRSLIAQFLHLELPLIFYSLSFFLTSVAIIYLEAMSIVSYTFFLYLILFLFKYVIRCIYIVP